MKKTIIIIVIVLFIATSIFFAYKRVSQLTAQTFDVAGIDIDKKTISLGGVSGTLGLQISNFAKKGYKIDNVNIELYSLDGNLIAYQKEPLKETIEIQPQANNIIDIPLYFKSNFLHQLYKQLKDKYSSVQELLNNYLATGHFGTEVIVRGFALKNGMKLNFEINKEV